MDGVVSGAECHDEPGDGGDGQEPPAPERRAQVAREEQLPDQDEQKANREEDEVLRDLPGPDELDHELDREQSKEREPGDCEPHAYARHPAARSQVTQSPESQSQRHDPRDPEPYEDAVDEIRRRPEDELSTVPGKISTPVRIAATPVRRVADDITSGLGLGDFFDDIRPVLIVESIEHA